MVRCLVTKKKSDKLLEKNIIKLLDTSVDDPESFDAFINAWNTFFDTNSQIEVTPFASIETTALSTISFSKDEVTTSSAGFRIGHLIEKFESPAYIVRENGQIVLQNSIARKTYNLDLKSTIADLPFDLELSESITDVVLASLNVNRQSHDAILKRAYSSIDDSTVTLSITPLKQLGSEDAQALVFIIDARWKTQATELLKREFDLSVMEQELLINFLDGQSTQSIAKKRQRSHTTIRSQLYSLMGKMGAKTQTDLLRNVLSVSRFVDQVQEIGEIIRHPYRKRVDLVRPGGRSVEVTMAGDLTGYPIVFFQSGITYTFESKIEREFRDGGYCILSICRPGYGDTDQGPSHEDNHNTFAADLCSLLDQLGHPECLIMSSNLSSAVMYEISSFINDRVSGIIQVSSAAPLKFLKDRNTSVTWAKAMLNAVTSRPAFRSLLMKISLRAWKALGQAKFRKMTFKMNAAEYELATRPEALKDAQDALDTATKQGLEILTSDMIAIFSDFTQNVMATDLPILVVHGALDPVFDINALREFANAFESRVTFVEIPDAGFSVMATHSKEIVRYISDFNKKNSQV